MAAQRHVKEKRRGLALVEAALVIPLLFLVLFGMLEYSWAFLKVQQLNGAARQGARAGIVQGAVNADVTAAVTQVMTDAGLAGLYTVDLAPNDVSTIDAGDPLTVTVTCTYADIELIGMPLIPTPTVVEGRTSMAKEGPID